MAEEDPISRGARGLIPLPEVGDAAVPLAFPHTLVFLCLVEKNSDVAVVLETVETAASLV